MAKIWPRTEAQHLADLMLYDSESADEHKHYAFLRRLRLLDVFVKGARLTVY
jgi:hypothetical protein